MKVLDFWDGGRKEGRDMGTKEDIVCWLGDHFLGF